ncbi:PEP-CTERM sorting domain-containing protein [Hyphococcus sp.]|uniref:PEP-CTERM sorting domain-containing protein n=1 Tax=Hyphococcus sp. TaxID=2038636 RepID=UPI003CCB9DC4
MSKILNTLISSGLLLFPTTAGATVIASSSLSSGPVEVTFSDDVSGVSGELFSTASASLGPTGVVTSDNNSLPGVADAPAATDGAMTSDSIFTVDDDIFFSSESAGSVSDPGEFGNAIGEVTGSFEFTNEIDGLTLTIVTQLTRSFDLATDFTGELASGATSLSLALLNTVAFLPTVQFSNPSCDPNAAFSVSNGDSFSDTCTTMATYVFENLPAGIYTLTFASNSSVDVVSEIAEVPVPAAFGLFALGLAGLRWRARKKALRSVH